MAALKREADAPDRARRWERLQMLVCESATSARGSPGPAPRVSEHLMA
jgi:hypothetical protein